MGTETEQAYGRIQALVKENPELGSTAAAKLAEVVEELEKLDVTNSEEPSGVEKLSHGFEKFKKQFFEKHRDLANKLKTGQWPTYMLVACADSRVDPAHVLGLKPGDAFIIRNIANMVPAYEKEGYPSIGAALEYAVLHLKVKHIVVIGHRACGGVNALVKLTPDDGKYSTTFIERWVEIGKPTRALVNEKLKGEPVDAIVKTCEKESVNNSLANLLTYPFVAEAVKQNKVTINGGYYDHIDESFESWAGDSL